MCGIAGIFSQPRDPLLVYSGRMALALTHRGPDAQGTYIDEDRGIALSHRRLAIIDVSHGGAQPMRSHSSKFIIAFNGEIYNFNEIKALISKEVPRINWRGHSDTEVLLEAIELWGLRRALHTFDGMFAFALWNNETGELTLVRDRFGEKPLYYGFANGHGNNIDGVIFGTGPLLFGSELKALSAFPEWTGTMAEGSVKSYLRFGCVGSFDTIFRGVAKIPPGCLLIVNHFDVQAGVLPAPTEWWSAQQAARNAVESERINDADLAVNMLESALSGSVRARMIADVPVGAFLSGGVDSSLILALMQRYSDTSVKSFSVGFDDARYDESLHAEAVAAHLGTEHITLRATPQMALDLVPRLPELYDEPFADSSQLPMALISRLTREHVTVALSGDAGDELFAGYNRHLWVPRLWRRLEALPLPARRGLACSLKSIPSDAYDWLMRFGGLMLPDRFRLRTFGQKLHKLAAALESSSERELFGKMASMNQNSDALLIGQDHRKGQSNIFSALHGFSNLEWMLLMDTLHYMVDDVLVKVDRASMASGLEVRVPFLAPDVFQAAWKVSNDLKIKGACSKWILRQLLFRYVPQELIDRPKMGFAVPLDAWLRGPLRSWAEDLLSFNSLTALPMLDARHIRHIWHAHLKGRGHYAQQLWTVLQLLAWQRKWKPNLL